MSDYIKREDAVAYPLSWEHYDKKNGNRHFIAGVESYREYIESIPSADVVEVVRCKDCKHRPIDTQEEGNGFDYDFPEEYGCPGYCDDGYYSQRFKDDFYCACGERADT